MVSFFHLYNLTNKYPAPYMMQGYLSKMSNSVSRVLYLTVIYLAPALPQASSPLSRSRAGLFSLGLLRVGFTREFSRHHPCVLLPHISTIGSAKKMHSSFCTIFLCSPIHSLLHYPWNRFHRSLTGTLALWSPDFPHAHMRPQPSELLTPVF